MMSRLTLASLVFTLGACHTVAADKRPFTIEDLYALRAVSDPRVAPDGASIAFVVTEYDLKKGKSTAAIHRIGSDGGEATRVTFSEGSDSSPRWSPDGKTLLFISTRKEGSQIWLLPVGGGEARQLTHVSTGVAEPVWSPDGKRIAFASDVFPEYGADNEANKKTIDSLEKGPVKAYVADDLLFRHWDSVKGGRRTHILVVEVDTGKVRDLTPGDYDSPAFSLGGGYGFAFSPDGEELCFVSDRGSSLEQATATNKDLWVVPIDGGDPRNITTGNPAYDGDPQYSPDGKYIAFRRQAVAGFEADRFRLALFDRSTGATRDLTGEFDDWVGDFEWAGDSHGLVFSSPVKGRFPLHRVTLDGRVERIEGIATVREFDLAPDGNWIAFTRSTVGEPLELLRAPAGGGDPRLLSRFNEDVAESVDLRPAEEMWIEGAAGHEVHVFIVKPHGFLEGKKYPLIINVHGGPQSQWSDSFRGDWQVYPGAGYVVAFFNPHGSTGYGQQYTDAISRDWGGKVYEDVMRVVDALERLPYVDSDRVGAMGWSYGGYMMNWILGHTDRFEAVASMMGIYDLRSFYGATEELWFPEWDLGGTPWNSELYEALSPSSFASRMKTPTLILTGEKDYRVPYTQSLMLFTTLQRRGVPSRLVVFEQDGHWPSFVKSMPVYYNAHLEWFHRYLGGDPAPYDTVKMVRNEEFAEETEKRSTVDS